jgi:hypothetical protein
MTVRELRERAYAARDRAIMLTRRLAIHDDPQLRLQLEETMVQYRELFERLRNADPREP